MSVDAANAIKVAIDAGASLDEMQRVLLKTVKPEDLFRAIRTAAESQKEQQQPVQNQSFQLLSTPESARQRRTTTSRERKSSSVGSSRSSSSSSKRQSQSQQSQSQQQQQKHKRRRDPTPRNEEGGADQLIPNKSDDPLTQLAMALAGPPPPGNSAFEDRPRSMSSTERPPSHPSSQQQHYQLSSSGTGVTATGATASDNDSSYSFPPPRPDSRDSTKDHQHQHQHQHQQHQHQHQHQQQQQRPSSSSGTSTPISGTTPRSSQSNSRPSSASENAALMNKLEAHAQKKQMLGSLVSQFQQLLSQTNDPLDTMKERLKEMDRLQEDHLALEQELEQSRARTAQVEDGAARQVRGVLDTNAKLQQELVQLSRDLTEAESALDSEKKRAVQETKDCEQRVQHAESEMELHSERALELQQLSDNQRQNIQSLEESKRSIVTRLQQLTQRAEKLQDENDELTKQKDKIGKHVWNLTDKLKAVSNELELASAQQTACKADMEELVSAHRKDMDERSRKEGKDQAKNEENERLWLEKETTLSSNIQELEERMKSAVNDAERYELKAREMDRDVKEAHSTTLGLRREVARISAHNSSLQRDLDQEREELIGLRSRAAELETMSSSLKSRCEMLETSSSKLEATLKLTEETNATLRKDLRGEQMSRQEASARVEELRKEMDVRNRKRIEELAALEEKNQVEITHHEKRMQEKEEAEQSRRELMETEIAGRSTENEKKLGTEVAAMRELVATKQKESSEWEERCSCAEQGLEDNERKLSATRMLVQELENRSNDLDKTSEKSRLRQQQSDKKNHSLSSRVQDLESSKAELLGELRDRNAENIRIAGDQKNDQAEWDEERSQLKSEIQQMKQMQERADEEVERMRRKTSELQQTVETEREERSKTQDSLSNAKTELLNHRTAVKEQAEEVTKFSGETEKLRNRVKELETERSETDTKLELERKQHREDMEELRNESSKSRGELERSMDERRKVEHAKRTKEREDELAARRTEMEEMVVQHRTKMDETMKDVEDRKERQMMEERTALRSELSVIQQHMTSKVEGLEGLIRGLTSESEKYQSKILELNKNLERSAATVRQHRERERLRVMESESLQKEVDRLKQEKRTVEERMYNDHQSVIERIQAELEGQRQRHQDALAEIEAEEGRSQELRRKLEDLESTEVGWTSKVATLEARVQSEQTSTNNKLDRMREDLERYELKIKGARSEKNEALKAGETLRLKLRSSEREKADLEHQLHVVKSEEEWARRELQKVSGGGTI